MGRRGWEATSPTPEVGLNELLGPVRIERSIQEFPSVRPIEASNDDRLQKRRFKIPQVHSVTSGGCGFNRLPMGDDTAGFAPNIPQGSIAPDVALRILGMTLDRDRAEFVVGPNSSCAPT
jgi:hypothetical protein